VKFARAMADLSGVGLLIALGLIVLVAAALLVRRSPGALLLATLLAGGSAAVWFAWANNAYHGLSSCPWDTHNGSHPVLVGLGLSLASLAIMTGARWKTDSRGWAAALGLSTGALAGVAIVVVAFLFGAGLRCTD
jgi:hypothetical protein